jgi:hypothetical protein
LRGVRAFERLAAMAEAIGRSGGDATSIDGVSTPPRKERSRPGIEHLNGKRGLYSANEGLWIGSSIERIKAGSVKLD